MQLNELTALSPIDGRYRNRTAALAPYLSEWGLMKYRVEVEVEYFIALVGDVFFHPLRSGFAGTIL